MREKRRFERSSRAGRPRAGRFGIAVALMAAAAGVAAPAADLSGNAWIDSTIELVEEAGEGPYRLITITMTTRFGETAIVIDRDGTKTTAAMSTEEYLDLWRRLRELDIGNLTDASTTRNVVDQPLFRFRFINGSESHVFSAYGVDFMQDRRYRQAALAIIELAGKHGR